MPLLRLFSRDAGRRRQRHQNDYSGYNQICQSTPDPSENENVVLEDEKENISQRVSFSPDKLYEVTLTRKAVRKPKDTSQVSTHSLGFRFRVMDWRVILLGVQPLEDGTPSPAQDCGLMERGDLMVSVNGLSLIDVSSFEQLKERLNILIEPNAFGIYQKTTTLEMASGGGQEMLTQYEASQTQMWIDQVMKTTTSDVIARNSKEDLIDFATFPTAESHDGATDTTASVCRTQDEKGDPSSVNNGALDGETTENIANGNSRNVDHGTCTEGNLTTTSTDSGQNCQDTTSEGPGESMNSSEAQVTSEATASIPDPIDSPTRSAVPATEAGDKRADEQNDDKTENTITGSNSEAQEIPP